MATLRIKLNSAPANDNIGTGHQDQYFPGSRVSGNVVFDSPSPLQLSTATVTLRGRGKVKIRTSEHYFTLTYRSRALFFPPIQKSLFVADNPAAAKRLEGNASSRAQYGQQDHDQSVTNGHHVADKPIQCVWPFDFQIPHRCDVRSVKQPASFTPAHTVPRFSPFDVTAKAQAFSDRPQATLYTNITTSPIAANDSDTAGIVWENDYFKVSDLFSGTSDAKEHALPGTFDYSTTRGPIKWEGRIEYELIAIVTRTGGSVLFPTKDLSATRELPVSTRTPTRAAALLKQRTKISMSGPLLIRQTDTEGTDDTVSKASASAAQTRRTSLLNRTHSLLRPGAFTKATLFVSVETPSYVRPGKNIFLSISHMRPPSSLQSDAPVPKLRLKEFTLSLLSTTTVRDNASTAQEQRFSRSDVTILHKRKELDILLPIRASDHVFALSPIMPDVPPSFSTFNILRGYWLSIEMRIEVAGGEIVKLSHDGVRVVVLSDHGSGEGTSTAGESTGENASTVVPTYEEATVGMTQQDSLGEKSEKRKGEDGLPLTSAAPAVEEQLPAYEP